MALKFAAEQYFRKSVSLGLWALISFSNANKGRKINYPIIVFQTGKSTYRLTPLTILLVIDRL